MRLADFSSFIEVATTLNIALVAIEYVKTYTNVLCSQVFNFQDFINSSFSKCEESLVDKNTLEHLSPDNINGCSTNSLIEKAKRDREKIVERIKEEKASFKDKIKLVCEAQNISSVSLWHFFLGLTGLFFVGIENYIALIKSVWGCMIVFSIIYSVCGWIAKDKKRDSAFFDYSSLRHSIIYFLGALIISIIVSVFCGCVNVFFDSIWDWAMPLTLFIMYCNFIAAVIKVWIKAQTVKNEIRESCSQIQRECEGLMNTVDRLTSLSDISKQLGVDAPQK